MKLFVKRTTALILFSVVSFTGCRHARIILPPPTPDSCLDANSPRAIMRCESDKARQNTQIESNKANRKSQIFEHKFMYWGLKPKRIEYNAANVCPDGVYEVHEYSTWKDGLFAEITFGIYMPRHIKITCY